MRIALLLLMLLTLAPAALAQSHDGQAREILDRPDYTGYRVVPPERSRWDDDGRYTDGSEGEASSLPRRESRPAGPTRQPRQGDHTPRDLPPWLLTLFEVLAWIIMGAVLLGAVVLIGYALYKLVTEWRPGRKRGSKKRGKKGEADTSESDVDELDDIDEPVEDLPDLFEDALVIARRDYDAALREGDFARATLIRYRIFWLEAGWRGCVESTDVKTWRDALRMVRRIESRRQVRQVLRLVEQVRYSEYVPDEREFHAWREQLEAIPPKEVVK